MRFYYPARFLSQLWLTLFTHRQVKGRENIPRRGPLIVVANHVTAADPPVIAASLNRKVAFMAKAELFRSRFRGFFLRRMGSFPVRQGRLDLSALRMADRLLAQGHALAIFPEGRSSYNGKLQPPLPGSALIAARNGVPILPVAITGTEKIKRWTWWFLLFHRPRITVNIGHPFHLPPAGSRLTKADLAERAQIIMSHIAGLLPQEYQGDYAP